MKLTKAQEKRRDELIPKFWKYDDPDHRRAFILGYDTAMEDCQVLVDALWEIDRTEPDREYNDSWGLARQALMKWRGE